MRHLHRTLGLGIQGAGGFIKQQNRRILEQSAVRSTDALLLAAGQASAMLTQFAIEPFG